MFYYRYRPGNELSVKELIYDEMYFASRSECNDPYEGKFFAELSNNTDAWSRLVDTAFKHYNVLSVPGYQEKLVNILVSKSPISVGELLNLSEREISKDSKNSVEALILQSGFRAIKNFIRLYIPSEEYFVSFSKSCNNFLMWSHYANNHQGYCLIFRSRNGKIYQNPDWLKKSFSHKTPHSFAPRMAFAINKNFTFKDIKYISQPDKIDGFLCMPEAISGKKISESEIQEIRDKLSGTYFQKHSVWEYEDEARITIQSGISWLAGEPLTLTPHQRLFHYDPTQLVGIVLGAKMSHNQKNRIREIVAEKVDRWFYINHDRDWILDNFVLFEERLSESNREVQIVPIEIYGHTKVLVATDNEFQKHLDEWENGWVCEFTGKGGKKVSS